MRDVSLYVGKFNVIALLLLFTSGCQRAVVNVSQDSGHPYGFVTTGPIQKLSNGGRPLRRVPFPPIVDWRTLKISLARSPCFGRCPAYSVEIASDGTVRYHGDDYVAVSGRHEARIPSDAVRDLYDQFAKADFFSTYDEYRASVTDFPTNVVTIAFDGHVKSVTDYVGRAVGMPKEISDLENAVDSVAETRKWVSGDATTFSSLVAEHWDFRADDDDRKRLVESAAQKGNGDLVRKLLAAGVSAKNKFGCHGLEDAAQSGNNDIVVALLDAGAPIHWDAPKTPKADTYEYDCDGLSLAAESGSPVIVGELLSRRPNVNWQDANGTTALMRAVPGSLGGPSVEKDRDFPLVAKLLIDAGADVNLRDHNGSSAIMKVQKSGKIVQLLLAAGARDVNKQDWRGETVLFTTYDAGVAEALLEGGADPWLLDEDGKNAYEVASRMYGYLYEAGPVLKTWMKTHPKAPVPNAGETPRP